MVIIYDKSLDQGLILPWQTIDMSAIEVVVKKDSLTIDDAIEERSTAKFVVIDMKGVHTFVKGQEVKIIDANNNTIFNGVIDKPVTKTDVATGIKYHTLSCIDWHYLADKRIVAKAYENTLAGTIINDIVTNYLAAEGITVGNIQDGPLITEAVFNYVQITKAIDALAEKANFIWFIGYDKKLHFVARSTYKALFAITTKDAIKDSVSVEKDNSKYRNKQYIKGGKDITDPQIESFTGDGKVRTWVVGFPIALEPTVTLNGSAISASNIGIRGVEQNKLFYWSKGENEITQDESQVLLSSSDTLEVTYQGEYDIVAITYNPEQIEDRKNIEGNSGIVENVEDENENTSRDAAFQSANAKLEKYSSIGRRLKFTTTKSGLATGQLLTVNMFEHGIDGLQMLVESIEITRQSNMYYYKVSAVEGATNQSWAKMFEAMATRGQKFVVRQNISEKQILITLDQFAKTWLDTDTPNIFKGTYAGDYTFPGVSTYPMFAFSDRCKLMKLLDGSASVMLSKAITKQTGVDTGNIVSTTYIAPFEANGTIATVQWIGGVNSDVVVDQQAYPKIKTSIEAVQIDKTDIMGFTDAAPGDLALTPVYLNGLEDEITALVAGSL